MLKDRTPTSVVLVKRRDGALFLHVQLIDPAPPPIDAQDVIGVDLGIANLAVTDDGGDVLGRGRRSGQAPLPPPPQALQKAGTKSARRRLQKIRMKESGFKKNENHLNLEAADREGQRHERRHRP